LESFVALSVEIEIDVADVLYARLCSAVGAVLNQIHSHEHIGTAGTLRPEPGLKVGARDGFRLGNGLARVPRRAIPQ